MIRGINDRELAAAIQAYVEEEIRKQEHARRVLTRRVEQLEQKVRNLG